MKENIGIILAGGIGSRFGSDIPKQYTLLNNREIISYSIEAFKNSKLLDDVIVVVDEEEFKKGRIQHDYDVVTIVGGKTRNESFKNALDYIKNNYPECKKIIENNAACPMITSDLIDKYLNFLDEYDCVSTTYRITDALARYDGQPANREDYYLIQSPDAYDFQLLYNYFKVDSPIIHPAQQLPKDRKEYLYFDYINNIKITYPEDILKAEFIMNYNNRNKSR